ncbi:hypothetical protein [Variovorax sp. JS1663]|uniref:hypothetical protein n=1 Tax=Variovorax sp. JS1663 TaxID=1851577 RepID=UPI000B3457E3|nr:hypothetical protein [Variovorax sp. JS1663]OUM00176.1 hypothetical protein A8M77_22775 [Variovorax sp. JS1663]
MAGWRLFDLDADFAAAPADLAFVFPSPARLATALPEIQGVEAQAARRIRALAVAVRDGRLHVAPGQDREDFVRRLCEPTRWRPHLARWIALRALGDPDACPLPDSALDAAARWRPWRAYAWRHAQSDPAVGPPPWSVNRSQAGRLAFHSSPKGTP